MISGDSRFPFSRNIGVAITISLLVMIVPAWHYLDLTLQQHYMCNLFLMYSIIAYWILYFIQTYLYAKRISIFFYIAALAAVVIAVLIYKPTFTESEIRSYVFAKQNKISKELSSDLLLSIKGPAYLRGKLIVVHRAPEESNLHFDKEIEDALPKSYLANTPLDVSTIIVVDHDAKTVHTYSDGSPAERLIGKISIVDRDKHAVIYNGVFEGGDPPDQYARAIYYRNGVEIGRGPAGASGSVPTEKIIEFLRKLPHK